LPRDSSFYPFFSVLAVSKRHATKTPSTNQAKSSLTSTLIAEIQKTHLPDR
jgi:hypothetical protein